MIGLLIGSLVEPTPRIPARCFRDRAERQTRHCSRAVFVLLRIPFGSAAAEETIASDAISAVAMTRSKRVRRVPRSYSCGPTFGVVSIASDRREDGRRARDGDKDYLRPKQHYLGTMRKKTGNECPKQARNRPT